MGSEVVGTICAATERLLVAGGKRVVAVVTGLTLMECATGNIVLFADKNAAADYERDLVLFADKLGARHPGLRLIYARLLRADRGLRYGFSGTDGALNACCGGGRYNFNLGVSACSDPSVYVNWDGIHLTEAARANRRVADDWLRGPYAHPPILDIHR